MVAGYSRIKPFPRKEKKRKGLLDIGLNHQTGHGRQIFEGMGSGVTRTSTNGSQLTNKEKNAQGEE